MHDTSRILREGQVIMVFIDNTVTYTVKEAEEIIAHHKQQIKKWRKLIRKAKKKRGKK